MSLTKRVSEERDIFDFLTPTQKRAVIDDSYLLVPDIAPRITQAILDPEVADIIVPFGTYRPETPFDLGPSTGPFSCRLLGQGSAHTKIIGNFADGFVIDRFVDGVANHMQASLIRGVEIQNTAELSDANGKVGGGIRLRQLDGLIIEDCAINAMHGIDLHHREIGGGTGIFHVTIRHVTFGGGFSLGANLVTPGTTAYQVLMEPTNSIAIAARGHVLIQHINAQKFGVGVLATHDCEAYRCRIESCAIPLMPGWARSAGDVGDPDPHTLTTFSNSSFRFSGSLEENIVGCVAGAGTANLTGTNFFGGKWNNRAEINCVAAIVNHAAKVTLGENTYSTTYQAADLIQLRGGRTTWSRQPPRVIDWSDARQPVHVTKRIPVSAGETSKSINFDSVIANADVLPLGRSAGSPTAGVTASASPGSPSAGTHFYFLWFEAPHGVVRPQSAQAHHAPYEITLTADQSVTIDFAPIPGAGQQVSSAAYDKLTDPTQGRYIVGRGRGTSRADAQPDGIWYAPYGATSFTDDFVTAFDFDLQTTDASVGRPPLLDWIAPTTSLAAESLEKYAVIPEPNYKTPVAVNNKTSTGFDLEFDDPAGDSEIVVNIINSENRS